MAPKIIVLYKYNALLEQNVTCNSRASLYPAHSQGRVGSRAAVQTQNNQQGLC